MTPRRARTLAAASYRSAVCLSGLLTGLRQAMGRRREDRFHHRREQRLQRSSAHGGHLPPRARAGKTIRRPRSSKQATQIHRSAFYRPCSCPMPTRHAATFSSREVCLPLASGVPDRRLSASPGQKRVLQAGHGRLPADIPLTVPVPAECLPRRFSRRTANAAASERGAR